VTFTTQVHDFDPGITPYPSGLFWTLPFPASAVEVQFGAGKGRMTASNLAVQDFGTIPNALFGPRSSAIPATCSFDIHWSGPVTSRGPVTSPPGSVGELVESQATMTWSASNALGFHFQSSPANTTSVFAQLGRVRNGRFASG
jgi:hypothetical protein